MKNKLLVLGGSGFIGSHVAQKGINNGYETYVVCRSLPAKGEIIKGVKYILLDILNENNLQKISQISFNYIVNLSGYVDHSSFFKSGKEVIDIHFISLVNIVFHIRKDNLKRFVQIGSSDEYGNNPAPQNESQSEKPFSPYSFAKSVSTKFIKYLFHDENFPGTILRPFIIYGPGQKKNRLIPYVIHKSLNNQTFEVSSGNQIRDFLYIDDAVDAIFLALKNDAVNGRVINLGSGHPRSVKSVVQFIVKEIGSGNPLYLESKIRQGENLELYPDLEIAKKILKWESKIPFKLGLTNLINYIKKKG